MLLLVSAVDKLPAVASVPGSPGYDQWPGGDVVYAGGAWYSDGTYTPGSAPSKALDPDDPDSYILVDTGFTGSTSPLVAGQWGPWVRSQTLTLPRGVPFTISVFFKWEDGYLDEFQDGDRLLLANPVYGCLTRSGEPSLSYTIGDRATTKLGDHYYRGDSQMVIGPSELWDQISIRMVPAGNPTTWRVLGWSVEIPQAATGMWRLRQRQSLPGTDSWPLRQRQNGGHTGSWPLRGRQRRA